MVAPEAVANVPGGHREQTEVASSAEYVPAPHVKQFAAPFSVENLPAGQIEHRERSVKPCPVQYFPAVHNRHMDPFSPNADEYFPASQLEQEVCEVEPWDVEYVPASHTVQRNFDESPSPVE